MKLKVIYIFFLYLGAFMLFLGAFLDWTISSDLVPREMIINAWNIAIKRISTGVIGIAGAIITYFTSKRQMLSLPEQKKYALLQLIMGAIALFIAITGVVPREKEIFYENGTGFYISLAGAMIYLMGCILLYVQLRVLLRKESSY